MAPRVRDAHFFRKVPTDVTEATKLGGVISICAMLTIAWLLLEQYSSYRTVRHESKMGLDHTAMPSPYGASAYESVRLNLNITMNRLPCQFASVLLTDHLGTHQSGGYRNIQRVRLDKEGRRIGLYQPHHYGPKGDHQLADHVFPWHTPSSSDGKLDTKLSHEQLTTMGSVELDMLAGGKKRALGGESISATVAGAHMLGHKDPTLGHKDPTKRKLLAVDGGVDAAEADAETECASWADGGECTKNPAYMLGSCQRACARTLFVAEKDAAKRKASCATLAAEPKERNPSPPPRSPPRSLPRSPRPSLPRSLPRSTPHPSPPRPAPPPQPPT